LDLWTAIAELLRQGNLEAVLSAGRAELAAPCWWRLDRAAVDRRLAGVAAVPVTIVAMDAANWLAHYADHRFNALWRFHALHHSQEELSVLTSFRAHPLIHTTGFCWPRSRLWS